MTRFCDRYVWLVMAAAVGGCATMPMPERAEDVVQFEPAPVAALDQEDLAPVEPRSLTELLLAAKDALEAGNAAHEQQNFDEAFREYVFMLELLAESEPDPQTVYQLRTEFERILETTTRIARTYERTAPEDWEADVREFAVGSGLEYPDPLPERVLAEIDAIQNSYAQNFQAGLDRSGRYLPYIREVFSEMGLPEDLVWLAMVESQFSPAVVSHAGARGMWQFMKFTGHRYGLRTQTGLDERYDWKKSTRAAALYLRELYEIFDGSWPLAVSAYNMGEAGLGRAIEAAGGERDLWRLIETPQASRRIRLETKKFYSKLLASAIIANNPEQYGFQMNPHPPDDTDYVTAKQAYSLGDLEKESGLAAGTLAKLNPQLLYGYTPFRMETDIMVPRDSLEKVAKAFETVPELRPDTHRVARGETLSEIATMHGVRLSELMSINNIRSPRRLQVGQRLVIPGRGGSRVAAATESGRLVHTVRRGDTLSTIGSRYGVSVRNLQQWNSLGRSSRIYVGDRVYVSGAPVVTASTPTGDALTYTVSRGDNAAKIATAHGVPLDDLLAWNGLSKRSILHPGDRLKIYNGSMTGGPVAGLQRTHTVRRGETVSTIADRYGIGLSKLLAWNGLSSKSVIHPGDTLKLYQPGGSGSAITHVVQRGQNPWVIARRYGVRVNDLFDWNNWKRGHVLQIGDKVTIYQ